MKTLSMSRTRLDCRITDLHKATQVSSETLSNLGKTPSRPPARSGSSRPNRGNSRIWTPDDPMSLCCGANDSDSIRRLRFSVSFRTRREVWHHLVRSVHDVQPPTRSGRTPPNREVVNLVARRVDGCRREQHRQRQLFDEEIENFRLFVT